MVEVSGAGKIAAVKVIGDDGKTGGVDIAPHNRLQLVGQGACCRGFPEHCVTTVAKALENLRPIESLVIGGNTCSKAGVKGRTSHIRQMPLVGKPRGLVDIVHRLKEVRESSQHVVTNYLGDSNGIRTL